MARPTHNHKRYVPNCPACELNRKYVQEIVRDDITKEERDEVDRWYREGTLLEK